MLAAQQIKHKFDPIPPSNETYETYDKAFEAAISRNGTRFLPVNHTFDFANEVASPKIKLAAIDGSEVLFFTLDSKAHQDLSTLAESKHNSALDLKTFLQTGIIDKCNQCFGDADFKEPNRDSKWEPYEITLEQLYGRPAVCRHRAVATAILLRRAIKSNQLPPGSVYLYVAAMFSPKYGSKIKVAGYEKDWHKVCIYLTQNFCYVLDPSFGRVFFINRNARNFMDDDRGTAINVYHSGFFLARLFEYLKIDREIKNDFFDPVDEFKLGSRANQNYDKKAADLRSQYLVSYPVVVADNHRERLPIIIEYLTTNPFDVYRYVWLGRDLYRTDQQQRAAQVFAYLFSIGIHQCCLMDYVRCLLKLNQIDKIIDVLSVFFEKYGKKYFSQYKFGIPLVSGIYKKVTDKDLHPYLVALAVSAGIHCDVRRDTDITNCWEVRTQLCKHFLKKHNNNDNNYHKLMKLLDELMLILLENKKLPRNEAEGWASLRSTFNPHQSVLCLWRKPGFFYSMLSVQSPEKLRQMKMYPLLAEKKEETILTPPTQDEKKSTASTHNEKKSDEVKEVKQDEKNQPTAQLPSPSKLASRSGFLSSVYYYVQDVAISCRDPGGRVARAVEDDFKSNVFGC